MQIGVCIHVCSLVIFRSPFLWQWFLRWIGITSAEFVKARWQSMDLPFTCMNLFVSKFFDVDILPFSWTKDSSRYYRIDVAVHLDI